MAQTQDVQQKIGALEQQVQKHLQEQKPQLAIPVLREISLPMHVEAVKSGYAKFTVMQQQAVPSPPTADRG